MNSPTTKAFLAVILCGVIAGTSGLWIKMMTSMSAASIGFFRTCVPVLFLLPFLWRREESIWRGNNKKMLLTSGINAGRMYLYLVAYIYTSIGNAVVLFYSWPIFAAILGMIYLKERVTIRQIFLLLLAFTGLIIVYSQKSFSWEDRDFIGMLAALGAALTYAITVIIYKSESDRYHRNELIFFQNLLGAIIFAPIFFLQFPTVEIPHIGIGILYGIVIGVIVFGLFFYGLKYLPASRASGLMYMEVVSTIIMGAIFLQESLSPSMLLGGGMIIISSFLLTQMKS